MRSFAKALFLSLPGVNLMWTLRGSGAQGPCSGLGHYDAAQQLQDAIEEREQNA